MSYSSEHTGVEELLPQRCLVQNHRHAVPGDTQQATAPAQAAPAGLHCTPCPYSSALACVTHTSLMPLGLSHCTITCSWRGTVPALLLATLRHLRKDPLVSRIPTLRPAAPQWLCQASSAEAEDALGSSVKFCPIHKPRVSPPTVALALPLYFLGDYPLNPEYGRENELIQALTANDCQEPTT